MSRARIAYPKTVKEFRNEFSTAEACLEYLVKSRWPEGFRCRKCGHGEYWLLRKGRYRLVCRGCRSETSPTAGTLLHRSHVPIQDWFWTAYTMATMTPGLSATQLARQLGVQQRTAWFMLQRLRRGMVNTSRSKLSSVIEADESLVGGTAVGFHSRGTTKAPHKSLILGAVEVEQFKAKNGEVRMKAARLRLEVVPNASAATIKKFMEKNVEPDSVIFTDGWRGYSKTALSDYIHHAQAQGGPANASKLAPHIHRVFSNLKTWLTGTHHGVDPKYLQNYLDEFVFRFNRRQTPMAAFQTLLGITSTKPHQALADICS